jgi:hypothetical protein
MNKFIFDAKPHKCCRGILYNENENMTNCCGDRIYDITKYVCCGGKLTERKQDSVLDCCDDKVYDVRKASCCGDKVQLISYWKLDAKCPTCLVLTFHLYTNQLAQNRAFNFFTKIPVNKNNLICSLM